MTKEEAIKIILKEKEYMHDKTSHPCTIDKALDIAVECIQRCIKEDAELYFSNTCPICGSLLESVD